MIGPLAILVALTTLAAPTPELQAQNAAHGPPEVRLFLTTGAAVRSFVQDDGALPIRYGGLAPTGVRLSAAGFLQRLPLGLALDASGEWFSVVGKDFADTAVRIPQSYLRLSIAVAGRWAHDSGFSAEAQLGYALGQLPMIRVSSTGVGTGEILHHGPQLAIRLGYEPGGIFGVALQGHAMPLAFGPGAIGVANYAGGLEVGVGKFALLGLSFAGFFEYEFSATGAVGPSFSAGLASHRVGLGLQAAFRRPAAAASAVAESPPPPDEGPPVEAVTPTGPGTIRGVVTLSNPTAPGAAIMIRVGSAEVATGADGSYVVHGVGPGPVPVTVVVPSFESVEEIVMVPPAGEARLDVVLKKVKGPVVPATLRGLVRSAAGAPVQAQVKIAEASISVKAGDDGRFLISLPGGKYTMTIEAPGYESQSRVVEVADGDQAIFHCDLQPRIR